MMLASLLVLLQAPYIRVLYDALCRMSAAGSLQELVLEMGHVQFVTGFSVLSQMLAASLAAVVAAQSDAGELSRNSI